MTTSVIDLADHWQVIQADGHGVCRSALSTVAPDGWYRIVRPPTGVEPARVVRFMRGELGAEYGFVTIGSIAVDLVTPDWLHFPVRRPNTWICSAIAAEAIRTGGWYHRWPTVYGVTPAQLDAALTGSGGREIDLATARPGDVGFAHSAGVVGRAIRLAQRLDHEPMWAMNHAFVFDRFVPTATVRAPRGIGVR